MLPVIVLGDVAQTEPLARALVNSGLHTADVTFRTPEAADALAVLADHRELLVGAGTMRSADQVDRARAAGARFVVSPGFSVSVVYEFRSRGLPLFPGVASATDIHRARETRYRVLKFFPAEAWPRPCRPEWTDAADRLLRRVEAAVLAENQTVEE